MKISYVISRKYRFFGIFFALGGSLAGQVFGMDPAADKFSGGSAILGNQVPPPPPPQVGPMPSFSATARMQGKPPVPEKPEKFLQPGPKAPSAAFTPSPLRKTATANLSQPAKPVETEIEQVRRLMAERKAKREGQQPSLPAISPSGPNQPSARTEIEQGRVLGEDPREEVALRVKVTKLLKQAPTEEQMTAIKTLAREGGKAMTGAIRESWKNKLISLGVRNPTSREVEDIMSQARNLVGNPQAQVAYVQRMQESRARIAPKSFVANSERTPPSETFEVKERRADLPPEKQNPQDISVSKEELSSAAAKKKLPRPILPPKPNKKIQEPSSGAIGSLPPSSPNASEVRAKSGKALGSLPANKDQPASPLFPPLRKTPVVKLPRNPEPASPLQEEFRRRAERAKEKKMQVGSSSPGVAGLNQAQIAASEGFRNASSVPGDKEEKLEEQEEQEEFPAGGEREFSSPDKPHLRGAPGYPHEASPPTSGKVPGHPSKKDGKK